MFVEESSRSALPCEGLESKDFRPHSKQLPLQRLHEDGIPPVQSESSCHLAVTPEPVADSQRLGTVAVSCGWTRACSQKMLQFPRPE